MIQIIKNFLEKYKKENDKHRDDNILIKNRKRFEEIHSNKRYNGLEKIYERLKNGDKALSDRDILSNYKQFSNSIQTNTFSAAELELVSISMICYYRPQLTKELLRESLRMILWSLGAGIDYSILKQFIDKRILMKDVEPYGGLPGNEGIEWLTNVGTNEIILIKNTLEEVIKQNDIELEELKNRHN